MCVPSSFDEGAQILLGDHDFGHRADSFEMLEGRGTFSLTHVLAIDGLPLEQFTGPLGLHALGAIFWHDG